MEWQRQFTKDCLLFQKTFLNIINLTNKMKNKMKSKLLLSAGALIFSMNIFAQVGINTATPQGTLDVVGKPTDPSVLDGVVLPRLTGVQLKAKTYTAAQTGAFVYVTVADPSPSGQTVNVVAAGTYFFTGTNWQRVITTAPLPSAQLILVVNGTGTQPNTVAPSGQRLAYFSNSATQGGSTIAINDPGSWNTTTQSYTAPIAGVYQIQLAAYMSSCTGAVNGAGGYIRTVRLRGGVSTVINTADLTLANSQLNTNEFTTSYLQAGDQIFVDYALSGASTGCAVNLPNISSMSVYRFQ